MFLVKERMSRSDVICHEKSKDNRRLLDVARVEDPELEVPDVPTPFPTSIVFEHPGGLLEKLEETRLGRVTLRIVLDRPMHEAGVDFERVRIVGVVLEGELKIGAVAFARVR